MASSTVMKNLSIATAGAALLALGTAGSANAVSLYSITDLGTLGGLETYAYGINNAGQVVGQSSINGNGQSRAFLWENGAISELANLGNNSFSSARDINDKGQVVGNSSQGVFVWENGNVTYLDKYATSVRAINDVGQVVGGGTDDDDDLPYEQSFFWENGTLTPIRIGRDSFSYDINNLGQVVGSAGPGQRGFLWENGEVTILPTLGGQQSAAFGINDKEQIVGVASIPRPDDPFFREDNHAFLWENGNIIDLGTLGGDYSFATDINENTQVVGGSLTSTGERSGFLWENGTMFDLNSLLPADSGWNVYEPFAINDKGQIAGNGILNGQNRAFLLTPIAEPEPVPEPASALGVLLFGGALGATSVLKRKRQLQS